MTGDHVAVRTAGVAGLMRAEITKLLTLPSVWTTVSLSWAVTLLLRLVDLPGSVLVHTQAGFLVLGVLAAVQEHDRGGQIRATLLAMPRRLPLALAKAVALTLVVAPAAVFVAMTAGEAVDVGGAGYLVLAAVAGWGVGMLLRNGVGAAGTVLGGYLVGVPLVRARLPDVAGWLPEAPLFSPAAVVWALVAFGVAAVVFRLRDA
ncbi:hypothetical protein ACTI_82530 [Actinoplanes sp. OR16]|uniref:hypothetical protein n=1 Tax=Actinoplanes sp. OR16 TaxID=946334 RepID=UPI000F6BE261|nr:hypothetical protein [Actinoplanes sp. OR16]BBH71568.1 hypothetical protein ACTI_82530 [Actinoplanes sp. OR16]